MSKSNDSLDQVIIQKLIKRVNVLWKNEIVKQDDCVALIILLKVIMIDKKL